MRQEKWRMENTFETLRGRQKGKLQVRLHVMTFDIAFEATWQGILSGMGRKLAGVQMSFDSNSAECGNVWEAPGHFHDSKLFGLDVSAIGAIDMEPDANSRLTGFW